MNYEIQDTQKISDCNPSPTWINNQWYAVYTVVRHEKKVNSALLKKNIETFLPLREVLSQWKHRRKKIQFPLFPGYLFVNIFSQDNWSILNILNTRGVVRILSINGKLVSIPDEQIDAIKSLLKSNLKYDPYSYFTQGREVVVINGPLQGVRGRILRRGDYRLIVSIDIIQHSVAVEIDIRDIELA